MDYRKMVEGVRDLYGIGGPTRPTQRRVSTLRDELAEAFEAVAQDDPDLRIDLQRIGKDMAATLAAGRAHPDSTRRFEDLAEVATALFDPEGTGDAVARWLLLVAVNAPRLVAKDTLGGTIRNAAQVSALVVRRLRDRPPASRR